MKKTILVLSVALLSFSTLLFSGCDKEDPDAISMEDVNKGIHIVMGADGKEYQVVDLGLTSGNLWAVCNIGATSPEQTGKFFAWGEVESKAQFGWETYRWCDGDQVSIFKYTLDTSRGSFDDKRVLDKDDEAAVAILGEDWRIPSKSDFSELVTNKNCTVKWCKLNGVGGFLFTSVRKGYEGNSIFFPLAGMNDYDHARYEGEFGWYWANSLYQDPETQKISTTEATAFWLEHREIDIHKVQSRPRRAGLPIRAVYKGKL